jgi:hypothetical protein
MNKQETTTTTETTTPAQQTTFEVQQGHSDDMQVVEFDSVPLTDINFGF